MNSVGGWAIDLFLAKCGELAGHSQGFSGWMWRRKTDEKLLFRPLIPQIITLCSDK
jgi:hypothetical protein